MPTKIITDKNFTISKTFRNLLFNVFKNLFYFKINLSRQFLQNGRELPFLSQSFFSRLSCVQRESMRKLLGEMQWKMKKSLLQLNRMKLQKILTHIAVLFRSKLVEVLVIYPERFLRIVISLWKKDEGRLMVMQSMSWYLLLAHFGGQNMIWIFSDLKRVPTF